MTLDVQWKKKKTKKNREKGEKERERERERERDRQTERETGRQTERETERNGDLGSPTFSFVCCACKIFLISSYILCSVRSKQVLKFK